MHICSYMCVCVRERARVCVCVFVCNTFNVSLYTSLLCII